MVGACRWLDWELARRWFVPAGVDFSGWADSEFWDWSVLVERAMTTDWRHRIGRSEASLNT